MFKHFYNFFFENQETWSNGTSYSGKYKEGMKEGQGRFAVQINRKNNKLNGKKTESTQES